MENEKILEHWKEKCPGFPNLIKVEDTKDLTYVLFRPDDKERRLLFLKNKEVTKSYFGRTGLFALYDFRQIIIDSEWVNGPDYFSVQGQGMTEYESEILFAMMLFLKVPLEK